MGRPELFKKALQNIYSTISTNNFLILVSADTNDLSMNNDGMIEYLKSCHNLQYHFGDSESKIHAINRDMDKSGEWDILVNMSDDMHFVKEGWDLNIERDTKAVWGDSLDWFAHYNDGYVMDALPTLSIMGRKYYERDNYIYHPSYKSFSSDAEAMYVAMMREKHHYFSDVLFKHQHPAWIGIPNDETYRKNSLATDHDTAVYWHRLRNYFFEPFDETTPIPYNQFI
jgi:hypothetical protein